MPVNVFEDSIDLHIDLLAEDGYTAESWPYPRLKKTGEAETRRFRTVILENEYLRLTFIPALGGRLWEMFDKRCNHTHFGDTQVRCQEFAPYTPYGAACTEGFRLIGRARERARSMGSVQVALSAADDPDSPASVLMAGFDTQSFSLKYSLAPQDATVKVEVTIQNRSLAMESYELSGFDTTLDEHASHFPAAIVSGMCSTHHVWFTSEPGTFLVNHESFIESYFLRRSPESAKLAPRQVDQYSFNLQPTFNLEQENFVGEAGIGFLGEKTLQFCASKPLLGHRLVIQNSEGQVFEAPVDFHTEVLNTVNLESLPGTVVAAKVMDPDRNEVAKLTTVPMVYLKPENDSAPVTIYDSPKIEFRPPDESILNRLTSDPIHRVPAYLELAARATERGDFQRADTCYEYALLFNGDDPLAWWAKAVNRRIGNLGAEGEERTELLNAHYLSPLEPCLRAESFLSQPRNHGKDPSPLLEPLNDCPESFIEVACQLIQARFYEEAAYFVDEALRHQNLAMLHYLQAWLFTRKGGMEMEVAHRLQLAAKAQLPPMPFRQVEREILTALGEKHPLPEIITQWLQGQLPD